MAKTENKKVRNATSKICDGIEFKSLLEVSVYKALTEAGFSPKYEPYKIPIITGFKPTIPFYTKGSNGILKNDTSKIMDITYTPDFVFDYKGLRIFIEVKGFENDVFPVKKKLFRAWLEKQTEFIPLYFEVWSKRQTLQAIEIIKEAPRYMNVINQIRELLPNLPTKKDVELATKFLDERHFVELKEIIDSDIAKMRKVKYREELVAGTDSFDAEKYAAAEETYNKLRELKDLVDPIAQDFLDPLQNSDEEEDPLIYGEDA